MWLTSRRPGASRACRAALAAREHGAEKYNAAARFVPTGEEG